MLPSAEALDSRPVEWSGQINETREAAQHYGGLLGCAVPPTVLSEIRNLPAADTDRARLWCCDLERPDA
jgi:hypothetical protein